MPRFRLIPTTIAAAMLFMAVKIVDIARGTEALSEQLFIARVEAGASDPPSKELPKKETPEAQKADKADAKKPAADVKPMDKEEVDKAKGSTVSDTPGTVIDNHLSAVQLELLQKLAERRDELNRWEGDIQLKENILNATEKRINDKILQIEAMKSEVSKMLALYNEKEDAKLKSLVKIYENMKPKDAARIFDEVEMPVLLMVIDKMSEKKVAPILADMD